MARAERLEYSAAKSSGTGSGFLAALRFAAGIFHRLDPNRVRFTDEAPVGGSLWQMPTKLFLTAVILLLPAAAAAQPVVGQGGVLNAASFTRDGLPGDGIARGGMFVVFGQGMGPATLVQSAGIPLTTDLAGTSMTVTVGGTSVSPFMLFTSSGQLAAVMPSGTPTGVGSLTVTFGGQTSAPVTIKVVENAFGIFTRNQAGFGPAIVQNFVSASEAPLNVLNQAAQPGQAVILWGSGLGPIEGSDADFPPVGSLPYQVDVIIGGTIVVQPFYAGRSAQFPGIDQVNFFLPEGIEGCYVSVAVRVNGVISNHGSLAVSSAGKYCSGPLSAEQIMLAEQQGRLRVGAVTLSTFNNDGLNLEAEAAEYSLSLLNQSVLTFIGIETHATPVGSCMVWPTFDDFFPVDPVDPTELVGGDITVTTPAGTLLVVDSDNLPEGFFPPGLVTVSAAAGPQVGAFEVSTTLAPPATLNAPAELSRVDRTQDLTLRWSGVDSTRDFVVILGRSEDQPGGVGRTFVCSADASAGQFTVPAQVAQSVPRTVADPASEDPPGFLVVASVRKPSAGAAQAPSIDAGYFLPIQIFAAFEPMFE